ncbi:MAG: hypothetical protein ABI435_10065 [Pseudolysinimonas sp.]
MSAALILTGCASPAAPDDEAADGSPTSDVAAVGLFDSDATAADLGAYLESAGVDDGAAATCQTVLAGLGSGIVSALPATFGDALTASLLFQSDPNWSFASGDDNRMTVKLRDVEYPAGETAICTYALPNDSYTRDVVVIFSDGTWGEIGAY